MQEIVISVSQLGNYIKNIFEAEEMLYNISIKGEVSGFRLFRGIGYFDLKDSNALLPCICFDSGVCEYIKNGDRIIARGSPRYYVKGGSLSFNVNKITYDGKGDLFAKYIELKEKLQKEGLFDQNAKLTMPKNVKKIGIITSPTGAVIEDIINVSTRRNPYINLVLFPTKVQGIGAENEVIQGLHYFENRSDIDLIIIARGGGSFEDLNVFNTESLAREVYKSKKFIISAIGHEIDYTILDFVADLRAPTPSASAELAVEDIATKKEIFQAKSKKFLISLEHFLQQKQYAMKAQKNLINNVIVSYSNEIKHEIILKKVKLEKLNPSTILKLGYARVIKEQKTILSKKELKPSDRVTLVFHDGSICADVKEKESGTRNSN